MAQTPIPSSSLAFKTREYYIENTSPNTAKGDTLTFEELDKTLLYLSSSITTAEGFYSSSFPDATTTPKAVGGINSGSTAGQFRGKSFSYMFDALLFPVINPVGTAGSLTATTNPAAVQEIGDVINVTVTNVFNQGTWTVAGQSNRNYYGAATEYFYSSSTDSEFSDGTNLSYTFSGYTVTASNNFPTAVSYSIGDQPINSDGSNFSTPPIAAGKLTDNTVSFSGVYPWFYGSSSAATLSVADVVTAIENIYDSIPTNAVRNVEASTGTIIANYPNVTSMWCWFATPQGSNTKQKWFETDLSQGTIGGNDATNAFKSPTESEPVNTYINGVEYKIYLPGYKTAFIANAGNVQLRNS